MKIEEYVASLETGITPDELSPHLTALWQEKRGDWKKAHEIVQDIDDGSAAWIHAYLHRREGDQDNAAYWYRQADRAVSRLSLDEEWLEIVEALID